MALESATYISDLVATNPEATDAKSYGDDHLRLLKSTVKATFPNVSGAVTPTHTELNYVDGVTSAIQTQLDAKQASDADLTAIAGLSSSGLIARTGAGTAAARTLTAPAAGITVSNGDGVSGNPTLALANDLAALEGLSSTGIVVRTGDGSATTRTLTAGTGCTVSNGDGVSGNPTVSLIPGVGLGDVIGPVVSVDSEIALFSGTGGKTLTRATTTGLLKATSGVLAAATVRTDYAEPTTALATGILKNTTTTGAHSIAVAGTDYQAPIGTISGLAKGNGANALTDAVAGTDYVAPGTTTNFTKPQRPSLQAETAPSANVITWDLTDDSVYQLNLNANVTTFNLTGTLANLLGYQYQLIVRYNGGSTIAWNAAFKWPAGTAPTLTGTSGKIDIFNFVVASTDGGTTCYLLNTGKSLNLGA